MRHLSLISKIVFTGLMICGIVGCGSDPREMVIGEWSVHPQDAKGANVREATQMQLVVNIAEDGTFVLTGGPAFEGLAGVDEIKGTYEFLDDTTMHVEMKTRAFDYEPTDYSITEVSGSELLLNSDSHVVTLIRE